jgi:shikimate dehydrogenase
MNIILIGFMGAGKTAVSRELSIVLKKDAVDMDELIAKRAGTPIRKIFMQDGELAFREPEIELAKELGARDNLIISTGGGLVMNQVAIKHLKANGYIIFLKHSFATAQKRLDSKNLPPLFQNLASARILYNLRAPLYEYYADIKIMTDHKTIPEVLREIGRHICVVIGDPIAHSLSPQIHNAGYKALGISSAYIFLTCRVLPRELGSFIRRAHTAGVRGISVTIPHKTTVMKYLDFVDSTADKIGAVNTIVNEHGLLRGYNTDWIGALKPLEERLALKHKKVVIIGAGGAARAIAYATAAVGAIVFVYDRKIHAKAVLMAQVRGADIIINATPVGMHPKINATAVPKKLISKRQVVMDAVYRPIETRLLREAKHQGARVISGMEMFLAQAAEQFTLFTGL